jgi:curved DNA-binding protein CbpA
MADLYEALGVAKDASPEEIKAAHRQAVKRTHPDAGGAPDAFARVQHAYGILSDQRRRRRYDETGAEQDTKDPEAIIRAMAMSTVAGKLNQLCTTPEVDPRSFDLVVGMYELIDAEAEGLRGQIKESRFMQERFRQFERRLKRKAGLDGPDMVTPLITAQVEAHAQRILTLEEGLKVLAAARAIAKEYVYAVDPVQQMVHMGTGAYVRTTFFDPRT